MNIDLSFGYNLCCEYSNGWCELILYIYILRVFQWYKELFNTMNFDPSNCSLKIWEFIRTPTHKVGIYLGVCGLIPSHFLTFPGVWMCLPNCTFNSHLSMPLPPKLHFQLTPFHALALVTNPRLGLWQQWTLYYPLIPIQIQLISNK